MGSGCPPRNSAFVDFAHSSTEISRTSRPPHSPPPLPSSSPPPPPSSSLPPLRTPRPCWESLRREIKTTRSHWTLWTEGGFLLTPDWRFWVFPRLSTLPRSPARGSDWPLSRGSPAAADASLFRSAALSSTSSPRCGPA